MNNFLQVINSHTNENFPNWLSLFYHVYMIKQHNMKKFAESIHDKTKQHEEICRGYTLPQSYRCTLYYYHQKQEVATV